MTGKILKIIFLLLVFSLGSGFGPPAAQDDGFDFREMFRKIDEKKDWQVIGDVQSLSGRDLLEPGPETSEKLLEFKIENVFRGRVQHADDSLQMNIMVFEAPDQILAFGLYAMEKSPSLEFDDLGFESFYSGTQLSTWYGRFVLFTETGDTLRDIRDHLKKVNEEFIKYLPKQKRETPILDALPEKDRVEHSDKFYLRRWLGQEYFQNIYYADYYIPQGYSRIFIIDNRTTAAADSNFWRYNSFIQKNASILPDELELSTDYFVVDEPLWGKTILTKKNQIIYGVLDFRAEEWTRDRLEDILQQLKKSKIVKSG